MEYYSTKSPSPHKNLGFGSADTCLALPQKQVLNFSSTDNMQQFAANSKLPWVVCKWQDSMPFLVCLKKTPDGQQQGKPEQGKARTPKPVTLPVK